MSAPDRKQTAPTEGQETPRAQTLREYRPNFVLAWLYRGLFSRIDVDRDWIDVLEKLAKENTVIHVMRSRSYLDFFALDFFLKRAALPVLGFVMNLGLWLLEPIFRGQFFKGFFDARRAPPDHEELLSALNEGRSALLFLRKPATFAEAKHRGENVSVDLVRVLIEKQRTSEKAIVLVPQVLVWGRTPDMAEHGVVDQLFGSRDYPGRLRVFAQFFWYFRKAILRSCEPLNLKELLAQSPELDDDAQVNRAHWILVTRLDRERRVILGPRFKSPDRVRDEVLRNPRVREGIVDAARREKKTIEQSTRSAKKELDRLAARPSPWLYPYAEWLMDRIFNRLYDGIEIDDEALRQVREQARNRPVILLPSHKSHLDYMLLSYVCWKAGMAIPLIAAGDNLSFWPAGPILRRMGAFFIRRSFAGARLYTALVEGYIRRLMVQGNPIEFFLEGGRSRTGKLLQPKVGLLTMVVEAAESAGVDVAYVPIAIGYERIVEQRGYETELAGGEKQEENAAQLVESLPQILTARYGRAYIQFGKIQSFAFKPSEAKSETAASEDAAIEVAEAKRVAQLELHSRREQVQALADRVMYEIGSAIPVTPASLVATALLQQIRGSVSRTLLLKRVQLLVDDLMAVRANFVGLMKRPELRVAAVDQVIALFVEHRLLQVHGSENESRYEVLDKRRIAVDYYKNNILHFFVPRSVAAIVLIANGAQRDPITIGVFREEYLKLCTLFAREFRLEEDRDAALERVLAELQSVEAVVVSGENNERTVQATPTGDRLRVYADMLQNTCEAWWLAARSLLLIEQGSMPAKELMKKTLVMGQRALVSQDLKRHEAVSKPLLESAFGSLRDRGVLTGGETGPQRRTEAFVDDTAIVALALELKRWCV